MFHVARYRKLSDVHVVVCTRKMFKFDQLYAVSAHRSVEVLGTSYVEKYPMVRTKFKRA